MIYERARYIYDTYPYYIAPFYPIGIIDRSGTVDDVFTYDLLEMDENNTWGILAPRLIFWILYWYLLSCLIVWGYNKWKPRKGSKSRKGAKQ